MNRLHSIAVLCLLLCADISGAQTIRGTVVRPADDLGIPGVVVLLLDASDGVVARTLTNERGEYRLAATTGGAYRLRTLRIGFRPATSGVIELRAGQDLTHRLRVVSVPFALDTVRVVSTNACRVRSDTAAATYAIWEQVRAALTATQISASDRSLAATVVTYDRVLDVDGRRVRAQRAVLNRKFAARPWIARSVEELRRQGYVVDDADGGKTYYAPDLDVLLSDAFLDDHCFRVAWNRDPARVALEFEPSRERRALPDIRGTIWLNRRTSELDRLEFRYANVSRVQEDAQAGGIVVFVRMATGAWAISAWNIRMPVLQQRLVGGFNGAARSVELRTAEIKISGGELALMTSGHDTIWAHAPLLLAGTVVDSVTGRAIRGAHVSLSGTPHESIADSNGQFAIPGMLPGEYAIEVRTASLDALGVVHQSIVTFTDGAVPITLRIPAAQQIAAMSCGPRRTGADGIVVGSVAMRGDTIPPKLVRVLAEWTDVGYDAAPSGGKPNRRVEARTDSLGKYRLCGVPLNTALVVRAVHDGAAGAPLSIRIVDGWLGRADLVLDRLPQAPQPP